MIQSLCIRNVVLIEELTISFHSGMQVLTGETGAGKSIVVDAVNLVLGGRADRALIRTGSEKASVEAHFDVSESSGVPLLLKREGIDCCGNSVILYREIGAGGKNLCRICGVIVTAAFLKDVGSRLMDIHGQHEHQFLMNPEMHLSFLDRMGDASHAALLNRTASACEGFLKIHREYIRMKKDLNIKKHRMEELTEALEILHAARLKNGEEELLQEECSRLRNAEKISSALRLAYQTLTQGETEPGCLERIRSTSDVLGMLSGYGDKMKDLSDRCGSIYYELEEVTFELSKLIDETGHDPHQLEKKEERLDLIRRLERKYGENIVAVLKEQKRMEDEYQDLCSLDDRMEQLMKEHRQSLIAYRNEAKLLSESRAKIAAVLEKAMIRQLRDLGMEKAVFRVSFCAPDPEKKQIPRPVGDDRVEFMISSNPGEPVRPLAKIASGGELSRLMLALKVLEADGNGVDCMVFDEIDTGISGRMAQAVAEKMLSISRSRQVISVTHLPQIAAAADYQFQVAKSVHDERTETMVTELDRAARIKEVARMISGADGSDTDAELYARSMIEASERQKQGLAKANIC